MNIERLLGQLLSGGVRRRPGVSSGVKVGAAVGLIGVALAALDHYRRRPATDDASAPPVTKEHPAVADQRTQDATLLIRAMIAAGHADGRLDEAERAGIVARADAAGLDADTRKFLLDELETPVSLEGIILAARAEVREQVYAASLLAITVDTDAERDWLDRLAIGLGLDHAKREEIARSVGVA